MTDLRRSVSRHAAHRQGRAVLDTLQTIHPGAAEALATDPVAHLTTWPDIVIQIVPAAQTDAGCSVSGKYFTDMTPPVLAIAEDASPGRRAFTALHELGHHLQQTHHPLMGALLDEADDGVALEDAACDAFAAEILLPTALVEEHLADGVTASAVTQLWRASSASRAAACVRAAQALTTPGHVLLLDGSGTVQFAAAHGLPPAACGSDQAQISVVHVALAASRRRAHGRTRLAYRDGIVGQELLADAADAGGYLVVVAVTDHAAWESGFSLPPRDDGPQARTWICEHCEEEFTSFDRPCPRCRTRACPDCGRCGCVPAVTERQCPQCNMLLPARLFSAGSPLCRDCA